MSLNGRYSSDTVDAFNIIVTAIGGIILVLGLVSDYFRRNRWASSAYCSVRLSATCMGTMLTKICLTNGNKLTPCQGTPRRQF